MTDEPSLDELLDPADGEGPVFDAPWQARAFGLVVAMYDEGAGFDWSSFQERLIDEIESADPDTALQDDGEAAYYEQWLAAFERVLVEEGPLTTGEIDTRAAAFATQERTAEEFVEGERTH